MGQFRFEPILSAKIFSTKKGETETNLAKLRWPLECSIKYDGVRLVEYNGVMVTRSLKRIRNIYANEQLNLFIADARELGYKGMDGEILVGAPNDPNAMQNTTSGLKTEGQPDFRFYLFDSYQHADLPYSERYGQMVDLYNKLGSRYPWLVLVEQVTIHNLEDFLAYEAEIVALGYEGIMGRRADARYKMGRSTMNEQFLMALKRFVDDEALVLEYREELENANEATTNELGRTHRSSHQANLIPKGRMGTMLCRSLKFDDTFNIGGGRGMTHDLRQEIYDHPERFQWTLACYSYQDIGIRTRPRLPRWRAFRSLDDVDPKVRARFMELADKHDWSGLGITALEPALRPGGALGA